jgi:hypothetical protein
LGGGPPGFPRGFSCPVVLGILASSLPPFAYRVFTFCGRPFQTSSARLSKLFGSPTTPSKNKKPRVEDSFFFDLRFLFSLLLASNLLPLGRFRLFPFRSPLLRESRFLSLPPGTKMFQFPGLPSIPMVQQRMTGYYSSRVAPFGYLRIYACLRLPEAFRSLPRPSSTLGAKASTVLALSC